VLATRNGLVKKTKLTDFDSNRSGGIVAVNLRGGDELVGAVLCSSEEDLLLVSAMASRSGSPRPTTRCVRWAERPRACRACGSIPMTTSCR